MINLLMYEAVYMRSVVGAAPKQTGRTNTIGRSYLFTIREDVLIVN